MRSTLALLAALSACSHGTLTTEGSTGTGGPMVFAIVGDTRPANPCPSTASCPYPTQIATIFQDMLELQQVPAFVVGTGDYMYNVPGTGTAVWQAQQYLAAARPFTGPIYLGMGNHECTGYTSSECGTDNPDGTTENYEAFLQTLQPGLGNSSAMPYFVETIPAGEGQTAKFVFTAANAWDEAQGSWLDSTLAQPTTYTFVVRHEPTSDASGCPGITPIDAILANHPLTMKIVGHTHEYKAYDSKSQEVLVGNGGAPLAGGDYGFAICKQRTDDAIQCDDYDYLSNAPTNQAFALTPAGAVTSVQ
jgi:hypothetical protein